MTCAQARGLLGAYRRDDWPPAEIEALGQHLAGCVECRRVEAIYRQVGESIRQLPSITPPESFRASVFAAINGDAVRARKTVEQLSSDDTHPRLPALRPVASSWRPTRPRFALDARVAVAVAAVLIFGLFSTRLLPALTQGFPNLAEMISAGTTTSNSVAARVHQYRAAPSSAQVTAALASARWVAYSATDKSGQTMLYAQDRTTQRDVALVASPQPQGMALSLRGISDHWVIWESGSGGSATAWTLWAIRLPDGSGHALGHPVALIQGGANAAGGPLALAGVWVSGDVVLAAEITSAGESVVARYDLVAGQAAPSAQVIGRAQTPGHFLAFPSVVGSTYYWAEMWSDAASLRSDIWERDASGQVRKVTTSGHAYAPQSAQQALVWLNVDGGVPMDTGLLASQPGRAVEAALAGAAGTIEARDLRTGHDGQVGSRGAARTLQANGRLIVWREGNQVHAYDLARGASSPIESEIRSAAYVGLGASSLVWGASGSTTLSVYDV